MARLTVFTKISSRQDYSDLLGQCDDDCVHKPYRRQLQGTRYDRKAHPPISDQHERENCSIIHIGDSELAGRPVIATKFHLRMGATSEPISVDRKLLGTSPNRPFRLNADISNSNIQQSLLGPSHKWSKCVRAEGLGFVKQLRECPIQPVTTSSRSDRKPTSYSNSHSHIMGGTGLVSKTNIITNRRTDPTTNIPEDSSQNRLSHETGTFEKQRMASIRVEDMWRTRLRCLGWSKRASTQSTFSLAQSTLRTYNGYINKYISFCQSRSKDFSDNSSTSVIAEFLCYMADHSDRPESLIKTCSAAVNYLFDALGKNSPVRN